MTPLAYGVLAAGLVLAWGFWSASQARRARLNAWARRVARLDWSEKPGYVAGDLGGPLARLEVELRDRLQQDREHKERLEAALGGMQDAVLVFDEGRKLAYANPVADRWFGKPMAHHLGTPYTVAVGIGALNEALDLAGRGLSRSFDVAPDLFSGRDARAYAGPLPGGGSMLVLSDRDEERKAERVRREFVANVSHELKTPLTAILASLETLADGAVDDPKVSRDFLARASAQGQRLKLLIDDILNLAALDEGKAQPAAGESSPPWNELRSQLERMLEPRAAELGAVWQIHPDFPRLAVPGRLLTLILGNLLGNAFQHAQGLGVALRARLDGDFAELSVSDRGPGLPPEALSRVFERFYRVDKDRSRQSGGSGLGLSIVKHAAESAGGQASVRNLEEGGCEFSVRLPLAHS